MGWRGLSPRRKALVVGVAAAVGVAAGALVVLQDGLPSRSPEPGPALSEPEPGPVLLVPGYGGSREALLELAERIEAAGRAAEVLTLPGDGTGDLGAQAAVLDGRVTAAVDAGARSVDVIGYSAGGVVARLWVAKAETARVARRVITLGAPLRGARLAAVGGVVAPGACPVACQQLTPGSALLRELDEEPLPRQLPWLSIWTEDDQTVRPPDSARLDGAVNVALQQVCPDAAVQHGQLPTDPLVVGLVLRALQRAGVPTQPDTGDCAALRAEGKLGS